jgi:putative FmdB family regulatory protein
MALYEFECSECGHEGTRIRPKERRDDKENCLICGGEMRRQVAMPVVRFVGTGWTRKATPYPKEGNE